MKITKKQLFISAIAVVLLILIIWGFMPSPVPVLTDEAGYAPLEVTIEEEGKTRVTDRYTISAPVTGYTLRLQHKVGDSLEAGQELFRIQPVPDLISARQREVTKAQLEAARTRLQQARENLKLANEEKRIADLELKRIQNLFEQKIGSEQGLDNAQLAARRAAAQQASARFAVDVAEFELEAARSAVQSFQSGGTSDQVSITAPVTGRLLKIHQKSEGTVQAGTPILEIGNPRSLEVQVDLLSTDAVQVAAGTQVRIKRWGNETVLEGVVRVVEPSGYTRISALGVEEQRVPVIVDIVSPHNHWRMLGDGFRVVAEFLLWQGEEVLQVPSSSLFRTSGQEWALFLVEGGTARIRQVEVGYQSGLHSQITGGLQEKEMVITHPDERIEDGVRVKVQN
ncbi:efflux RND transporter periplasmic adaptor subunit [Fodinibius sediminis]|uniref:HlyD family secretion protein n=1 Tax=Fodinibius sediminis TaxID=1214077 RepID=A0A521BE16_9BACT|nr:HlyD family efflux transporter periplasmic adaptor subunit [Fodinibius sediminis]SMO45314.1 HlyD family secretion protein [Fodinibius sediminis]